MNQMEIPEQLKQCEASRCTYPSLAHSRSVGVSKMNPVLEEVLSNLIIYVTPESKFSIKVGSILEPFVKINTDDYSKLVDYVNGTSPEVTTSAYEFQRNFAMWCATSGCGVAMTHLLSNIFTNYPQFSTMSDKLKDEYNNKFNLPNEIMSLFRFHVY